MKNLFVPCLLLASSLAGGELDATASTAGISAAVGDYTYSCWLNGWRKNANDDSADIFGVETSRYGFTLDVADFGKVGLGRLDSPVGYEQALEHGAEKLRALPPAELSIEVEVNGTRYQVKACEAGKDRSVKRLANVRLWESGRFVQHYDLQGLDFRNAADEQLACDATLDLVAWPSSLTFTLCVSVSQPYGKATLRLGLKSEAGRWQQELAIEEDWKQGQPRSLSMTCPIASDGAIAVTGNLSVRSVGGQSIPVRFDEQKNCYVASVTRLSRDWTTGYTDIRDYDEFRITVDPNGTTKTLPFLLDLRPPANITGLCPILCDQDGRPTGIPVQLSKNWHHPAMGSYLKAYALLPVDEMKAYTLRIVYGFYGTLPSASHSQLSLIGYSDNGGNGRWEQLAIGCWGETICFDMDMSLVDVAITDIRMLMARKGIYGRKWSWTNAGWGGDWLNLQDDEQVKYFWTDLKTAYLAHGPCLTQVKYEGCYGANREVDLSVQVQTLRTDDYNRVFQKLSYTFARNVSAKNVRLYKLGRTHNYRTPRLAYGNVDGLIKEHDVPDTLKNNQLLLDNVQLAGSGPYWVAFPGAEETTARNSKPNGYRALIIRQYKAFVDGRTYTNPTVRSSVHTANPTNLDIELLPPAGVRQFRRGDRFELDLELITLPRVADDYYGPNESFGEHLTEKPNSWETTYREAKGNDLTVAASGGRVLQSYPIVICVERPEVAVTIQGGIGAVPIRFEGLESITGYRLHQVVDGERTLFDQSVHGNDFWQTDYDAAKATYAMTFNLPLDGLRESIWILSR